MHTKTAQIIATLFFLLSLGCSGSGEKDTQKRGVIKADELAGSCEGRCGALADRDNPCFCDDECSAYGDCCSDFISLCDSCSETDGECKSACDPDEIEDPAESCVGGGQVCCLPVLPTCEEAGGECEAGGSCPSGSEPADGICAAGETCCKPVDLPIACTGVLESTGETMTGICGPESRDIGLVNSSCPEGQFCGISHDATCAELNGVCRDSCAPRSELDSATFGITPGDCVNQVCCRPNYCLLDHGGTCEFPGAGSCLGEFISVSGDGLCSFDAEVNRAACCMPSNKACEAPDVGRSGTCKPEQECDGDDEYIVRNPPPDQNGVSPLCPDTPGEICCKTYLSPPPPG